MGANPHANGGLLPKDLIMPNFREYAVDVPKPGKTVAEATGGSNGGETVCDNFHKFLGATEG